MSLMDIQNGPSVLSAVSAPEPNRMLLIIFIVFLITTVLFFIASYFIIAHVLFRLHLRRKNKSTWSRECSGDEPLLRKMYDDGVRWANERREFSKDVHIINDGLNLYGEYFDFGFDRAVIIVPGRTEGLRYSYYFAKPYFEKGYNVLAIDQRAHGESDGVYNTLGFEEHKDVIAWGKFLHDDYGVQSIMLHGNCIGSSCCLQALTNPSCPVYFAGMVAEGMYPNFYESFRNHMIELKRPVRPCIDLVDMWMRYYTGHSMKKGPADIIMQCKVPILMLHSQEDAYSLPDAAQKLYDLCNCKKKIVWFEKGAHSQLRVNNVEAYDRAIGDFLSENFPNNNE